MDQNKWYASSTGEGASLTLKGLATGLIPIVIGLLRHYNVEVTENEIMELVNAAFTAISSGMIVYGLGRKAYYRFFDR